MYIYIHTHTYIGASLIAELKTFWSGRSTGEGANPTPVFLDLPGGSTGKEPAFNAGDLGLIPGLGRSPGEGNGYPLQYSGLENSMDCIVHGVAKSRT